MSEKQPGLWMALGVVGAITAGFVATAEADPDLWWHVLVGREVVAQGGLPARDAWSYVADGAWVHHEWLSDVILARGWDYGGLLGVRGAALLFIVVSLAVACWQRLPNAVLTVILATIALPLVEDFVDLRPQAWTYAGLCAVLLVIDAVRSGRIWAACLLPGLILVWTQLHGGWIAGVLLAEVGLASLLLGGEHTKRAPIWLVAVGAACLVAPILDGNAWGALRSLPGELDWHPHLTEWHAPLASLWTQLLLGVGLPIGAVAIARQPPRATETLALLAGAAFTVWDPRGIALVYLVAPRVIATAMASVTAKRAVRGFEAVGADPRWVGGVGALMAVATWIGEIPAWMDHGLAVGVSEQRYPLRALDFLKGTGAGTLAVPTEWGGIAIWEVGAKYQVGLDGRDTRVFAPADVRRWTEAWNAGDVAGIEGFGAVDAWMVEAGGPIDGALGKDPRWERTFGDDTAVVYARSAAP